MGHQCCGKPLIDMIIDQILIQYPNKRPHASVLLTMVLDYLSTHKDNNEDQAKIL